MALDCPPAPQGPRARLAVVTEGPQDPHPLGLGEILQVFQNERQIILQGCPLRWRKVSPSATGSHQLCSAGTLQHPGRSQAPWFALPPDPSCSLQLGDQGRAARALRHGGARLRHRPAVHPGPRRQLRLELEGQAWPAGEQALSSLPPLAPLGQKRPSFSVLSAVPETQAPPAPGSLPAHGSAVGPGAGSSKAVPAEHLPGFPTWVLPEPTGEEEEDRRPLPTRNKEGLLCLGPDELA